MASKKSVALVMVCVLGAACGAAKTKTNGEADADPSGDGATATDRGSADRTGANDGPRPADSQTADSSRADSGGATDGGPTVSVSVLTQHNDKARTGANLAETILNTSNVNKDRFGLVFSLTVDGPVFAQPLYVPGVNIPGKGSFNVVYVATQKNKVYAFDADRGGNPLWMADFATYAQPEFPVPSPRPEFDTRYCPDYNLLPTIGITSTPVVDPTTGTIFVEAFSGAAGGGTALAPMTKPTRAQCPAFIASSDTGAKFQHKLHALDLATGMEKFGAPVVITGQAPGTGESTDGTNVNFVAKQHLQRPGLLLQNGFVYLGFGSYSDTPPYHGWVMAFNARNVADTNRPKPFAANPNSGWSGIWQAGNGLVGDVDNNVYFMTGNGNNDMLTEPYHGESFVKLPGTLGPTATTFYKDPNWLALDRADNDLGSAGPLLIPGTDWLIGGGKEGAFYSFDRRALTFKQKIRVAFLPDAGSRDGVISCTYTGQTGHIHGGPVFWKGPMGSWLYVWAEYDFLKAFVVRADGTFETVAQPAASRACPNPTSCAKVASTGPTIGGCGMPGGMLSVSANGATPGTGIVWANHQRTDALHGPAPATLYAFDAADVSKKLWDSNLNTADAIGVGSKNAVPTVANGRVYLGSQDNKIRVYGLK